MVPIKPIISNHALNLACQSSLLRICIWLVLQAADSEFYSIIATVCTSWVPVNVGTSKRSMCYPDGNGKLPYVNDGNCMCARILACILISNHDSVS